MPKSTAARTPQYEIINRLSVNSSWNGSPIVLNPRDNTNIPQTSNGSVILAWFNQSKENNAGALSLTSGGSVPQFEDAPQLLSQPSLLMKNWMGNNLSITNLSAVENTPIWCALYGPNLPGVVSQNLPSDGTIVQLSTLATAQGSAMPRWMQLRLANHTGSLAIFAIIGGPNDSTGNNGYVIAVNAVAETGPNTGVTPPKGYYATTIGNTYSFQFNWGSSSVFIAGMSATTSLGATVALVQL